MPDPTPAWCAVDDCPSSICKGPHVSHECGGSIVTTLSGDRCPFCGAVQVIDGGDDQ